jgi:hypothetical protein
MMPPAVELTVSKLREAIRHAGPAVSPAGPTAQLGKLFHGTIAGLLEGPEGWSVVLDRDSLDDVAALIRHAYERHLGPRLAAHEAVLQNCGKEVLFTWEALKSFCGWLCRLLQAAREKGWLESGRWLVSEQPLAREFHRPGWRAPVRLTGRADCVLRDPVSGRLALLEFKLGPGAEEADLAQAALYQALLDPAADIALVRFEPEASERLVAAQDLNESRERLLELAAHLAGVVPPAPPSPGIYDELGKKLVRAFDSFGLKVSLAGDPVVGPSVVRFRLRPGPGVTVNRVIARAADVGVHLGITAPLIQVEENRLVADLERPDREGVPFSRIREALPELDPLQGSALVPLGVDLDNRVGALSLADADSPHLLVAGTTGSGKTEWLRSSVAALLLSNTPETLRLILIDPKLSSFRELANSPYLWHPQALVYPAEQEPVEELDRLIEEMEERFERFREGGDNDLAGWRARTGQTLPRLVCIIDEFADLMADRRTARAFEDRVVRLGAKARAAGIHLVLATQHPDAKTVTGRLQANLPARVSFRTATYQQSLVALKTRGAERLLGKGDLLFSLKGTLRRYQAALLGDEERREIFRSNREQ